MEFSTRSMKLLIQRSTEKRVSDEAGDVLGENLDQWGQDISEDANEIAKQKGRKTVRAEDIREALRNRTDREVKQKLSH